MYLFRSRTYVPLIAVLMVAGIQIYSSLIPKFYLGNLPQNIPISFSDYRLVASIVLIILGHAFIVTTVLVILRPFKVGTLAGILLLVLLCVLISSESIYYAKYSCYPNIKVYQDVLHSPLAVMAFGPSAFGTREQIVISAVVISVLLLSFIVVRDLRRVLMGPAVVGILVGLSLLCLVAGSYLSGAVTIRDRMLAREHTFPIYRWYLPSRLDYAENDVGLIIPFLPRSDSHATLPLVKAKDILFVILESVRADHLPFYGYDRNTVPRLKSRSDVLVFDRMYAAGPATPSSFPVIFRSRYLAGLWPQESMHSGLFELLKSAGWATAFISSDSMHWNGISNRIGAHKADYQFFPNSVDSFKSGMLRPTRASLYLQDKELVPHYRNFLSSVSDTKPTFAAVHLCGTHFPYLVSEDFQQFRPSLGESGGSEVERLTNSYDNALLNADFVLNELIEILSTLRDPSYSAIIITSDHGEALGRHGVMFHSTNYYDEQVHVPFLIIAGSSLSDSRRALAMHASERPARLWTWGRLFCGWRESERREVWKEVILPMHQRLGRWLYSESILKWLLYFRTDGSSFSTFRCSVLRNSTRFLIQLKIRIYGPDLTESKVFAISFLY